MTSELYGLRKLKDCDKVISDDLNEGDSLIKIVNYMVNKGWKEIWAKEFANSIFYKYFPGKSLEEVQRIGKTGSYKYRINRGIIIAAVGAMVSIISYLSFNPDEKYILWFNELWIAM